MDQIKQIEAKAYALQSEISQQEKLKTTAISDEELQKL